MNTMFHFKWDQIILEPFLSGLTDIVQTPVATPNEDLIQLLSQIFKKVGSIPVANSDWDAEHRTWVAKKLLHESIRAVLKNRYHFQNKYLGVIASVENDLLQADTWEPIDINYSSFDELEALPVIGKALANRIIDDRRNNGYFKNKEDLVTRIRGLGEGGFEKLETVIAFAPEGEPIKYITGIFEEDLLSLFKLNSLKKPKNPLLSTLEEIAVYVSSYPSPSTRYGLKREDLEPGSSDQILGAISQSRSVRLLPDTDYYPEVGRMLETAQHNIEVCMFYIAAPSAEHPTRLLLDILVRKAAAGCAVSVLVDQDKDDDPYGSRLINAKAIRYLSANGVAVKRDTSAALLHSKFVIIDSQLVIIGSHNWTAGSFFHYADLSLALSGQETTEIWETRFGTLWANGEKFEI
ncbi:MAG: phospholipase D-like domain-containing protein [Saprospiraceae bacterium]